MTDAIQPMHIVQLLCIAIGCYIPIQATRLYMRRNTSRAAFVFDCCVGAALVGLGIAMGFA